ncbi:MAG: hypothetical protein DRQ99_24230 [Candidatus Parabeggiatoa sp. nov. 3]|nr:MAG: hypothetical protein DRQ99_24230 [Gammaproteobacteria bacterium]
MAWWATKTRYPPYIDGVVGNKNPLPAPYIDGMVGNKNPLPAPYIDGVVGHKNPLPAPYIRWWATKTRYPPYIFVSS